LKAWLEVQGGRVEAEMAKSALFPVAFMPLGAPAIAAECRSLVDLWADQADSEMFSKATGDQAGEFAQVWIRSSSRSPLRSSAPICWWS